MNHPTICFRKSAVLSVGNYNINHGVDYVLEDYELELKLMKKYFVVYNLDDVLVLYRIHKKQVTNDDKISSDYIIHLRNNVIRDVITNNL
jgi:GT2 family glycosyltransferase